MHHLAKELPRLEWRALTAHHDGYHFLVSPRGKRWFWRVRIDYAALGAPLVHDSSMVHPQGYRTSEEARVEAQAWLQRRVLDGRVE